MSTVNDDQLVERLVPKILASIRAKAKAVESVPISTSLEGITSLPAYDTKGGQYKQVLVPIDALKEFVGNVILCTEETYKKWKEEGRLDDNKIYFGYKPKEQ